MQTEDESGAAAIETGVDTLLRQIARAPARAPIAKNPAGGRRAVEELIGALVDGKYRVETLLGQGGMGAVYRATHLGTGRDVALKVLVPELASNDDAVERFRREAQAAGRVRHPNVIDVTDFGFAVAEGERLAYLVMELLCGQTLRALLDASGPLSVEVATDLLDQICAGVAEAHATGVLHRDLKPENIYLEPDARGRFRVKVLDFGIAKLLDSEAASGPLPSARRALAAEPDPSLAATFPALAREAPATPASGSGERVLTGQGTVIGTPHYMAPEQRNGCPVDVRTDVYSLGLLAYEMVTGESPFHRKGPPRATEDPARPLPRLAERAPAAPRGVIRAIESALTTDPAGRPPSVSSFAAVLRAGTETTGALLRRAISLCTEHYWLFFRGTALVWLPSLVVAVASLASSILTHRGLLPLSVDTWLDDGELLMTVAGSLLQAPVVGRILSLVVDLTAARRVRSVPRTFDDFWRTLGRSLPSAIAKGAASAGTIQLLTFALLFRLTRSDAPSLPVRMAWISLSDVLASAALAPFAVTGAVVAIEGSRGLRPLWRSSRLLLPLLRIAFGAALFWALGYHLLDMALNLASAAIAKTDLVGAFARGELSIERSTAWRADCVLRDLLRVLLCPFVFVTNALLYLRAREGEGSPFR